MKKLYLCNGNAPGCNKRHCWKNGGECRHTKNKKYRLDAVNVIEVNIGGNVWEMRSCDIEKMIDDAVKKKYESKVFL